MKIVKSQVYKKKETTEIKEEPAILVEDILRAAGDNLGGVVQWTASKSWHIVISHDQKAIALIELVEVADCGSTGGFGEGQVATVNLFKRWDWLYIKYVGNPEGRRFACSTCSYEKIRDFYMERP